jgi:hypothetical protein
MPDPKLHKDLLEYVKQQRAGGIPDAEIRRALLINHWPIADIDQVLAQKTSQPRGRGLGLLTKIIIGFFVVVFIEAGAYAWSTTQFHAQLASSPFATNTSFVPEALTPITGVDSTENNLQSPPIHSTLPSVGTTYASGGTSQSTNTGTVATQTTSPSLIDVLSEELLALESQLASQTSGSVVTPPIQGQGSNGGGGYEGGDDGGDEGGDGGGGQDYELPTCSVSADPASITDGDSSTLTWSTSNTSSIVITPDIGDSDLSGSQTVSPTNTTVYNLEAIGPGGITNCDATVTVNNTPPPPLPTCTLSAAPTSINLGDATTLTWSTTQATSVSITPDIGTVDDSGSVEDSPTQNTLYTLAATGPGGTANCTAPVTVVTQGGGGNGLTEVVPGASGVLLGIHVWPGGGVPLDESEFSSFEQSIGRPLAIDSEYYNWDELGDSDNTAIVEWDKQNGLLPMISWRPDITKNKDQEKDTCASANQILSGADDAQIKQQADTLKGYGTPILLRWNYEMTDNEFNYCFNNGAKVDPADYATAGPTYVAVWKYIHDIFTAEGATNVSWVWAPAASLFTSGGGLDATDWQYFYPGSSYVDWIANDHYNKTDTPESYATDPEIQNFYTEVAGLGKPLMQSETGAHSDTNQNPDPQTEWLTTMFTAMQTQYPAFRAMVYWDGDSSDTNNDDENQDNNPDDNNDDTNFGLGTNNGNGEDNVAPYTIVGAGLAAYTTFAEETPFNVIAQLSNNNDVQKANLNSNAAPAKTSLLTEVTNFILGTKTTSPSKSVTPATTSKKPTSSTSVQ